MTLTLDNRPALAGKPGLHALIAGVSLYRHLPGGGGPPAEKSYGMQQLSSTALTALYVHRWLLARQDRLPLPLATVRLLLSPSPAETAAEPEIAALAEPCTRASFAREAKAWRRDAAASRDGSTFFYFAGHGVQRKKGDAVLLCDDFGDPDDGPLARAAAFDHLFNGMAPQPGLPGMAERQAWFVDACRIAPAEFRAVEWLNVPDLWPVELAGRDDRVAPAFFAAVPGTKAYAIAGDQTLFSKALLAGLEGEGADVLEEDAQGEARWGVSVYSLHEALTRGTERLNQELHGDQEYSIEGLPKNMPLCFLDGPPAVAVSLAVDPPPAVALCRLEVRDEAGQEVLDLHPIDPHPYEGRLPAGYYEIAARVDPPQPPYADAVRLRRVKPPRFEHRAQVERAE